MDLKNEKSTLNSGFHIKALTNNDAFHNQKHDTFKEASSSNFFENNSLTVLFFKINRGKIVSHERYLLRCWEKETIPNNFFFRKMFFDFSLFKIKVFNL